MGNERFSDDLDDVASVVVGPGLAEHDGSTRTPLQIKFFHGGLAWYAGETGDVRLLHEEVLACHEGGGRSSVHARDAHGVRTGGQVGYLGVVGAAKVHVQNFDRVANRVLDKVSRRSIAGALRITDGGNRLVAHVQLAGLDDAVHNPHALDVGALEYGSSGK
jgi:hypothetical protein